MTLNFFRKYSTTDLVALEDPVEISELADQFNLIHNEIKSILSDRIGDGTLTGTLSEKGDMYARADLFTTATAVIMIYLIRT